MEASHKPVEKAMKEKIKISSEGDEGTYCQAPHIIHELTWKRSSSFF